MKVLNGLAASGGYAIASAYLLGSVNFAVTKHHSNDWNHEVKRLHDSFVITRDEIKQLQQQAHLNLGRQAATVMDIEVDIMADQEFYQEIHDLIKLSHCTAEWAVAQQSKHYQELFQKMNNNDYLRQRATAITEVRQRLLSHLLKKRLPDAAKLDHPAIIVASSITPNDMVNFNDHVRGLITDNGGPTSHFAIMSQQLRIPTVVGTGDGTKQIKSGDQIIVDGVHGKVIIAPDQETIDHYQRLAGQYAQEMQRYGVLREKRTISRDGHHFIVAANIAMPDEAAPSLEDGAEGVGLLRTEFLYMHSNEMPDEERQFKAYKQVLTAMPDSQVVMRTLDIGGDKRLGTLRLPSETNPFLGFRAIRVGLKDPQILRTQVRAMLRASAYGRLAIMFPLVATLNEFEDARTIVDEEKHKLTHAGVKVADDIQIGMMVEVPSAVTMADQLAREADFFSIGSNDLIQYMFAADRGNRRVSYLYKGMHPAVLRSIKRTIDAAHAEGKWVGLCGELAAKQLAIPLLVAMGLDEFSMTSSKVTSVRSLIKQLEKRQLQPLLHQALAAPDAEAVCKLVRAQVPALRDFN